MLASMLRWLQAVGGYVVLSLSMFVAHCAPFVHE